VHNFFKVLVDYLQAHRKIVLALLLFGFLASLFEGIGIGLFIPFLQELSAQGQLPAQNTVLGKGFSQLFASVPPEHRILAIALAIFGMVVLKAVLTYVTDYFFTKLSARTGHDLREKIFARVMTVDFRTLDLVGAGKILNAVSHEIWETANAIDALLRSVISFCTLVVFVGLLMLISLQLTLIVIAVLALIALAVRALTRKVRIYSDKITRTNAAVASQMIDSTTGIEVVRAYGQEEFQRKHFARASHWLTSLITRRGMLASAVYPIYEVIAATVLVAILLVSIRDTADVAPFIVFVFLLYRLAPVVKRLEKERVDLLASSASVIETFSILDQPNSISIHSGKRPFEGIQNGLDFENVSYQYDSHGAPAVHKISVRIPAQGVTAIVGPSGAGKSTLIKLLLRFFDPTEGQILVDGMPLAELNLDNWRSRLAVVPQKPHLFNASVRENIAYGDFDASDEQIREAARDAGANDFIESLAVGYETKLGEDGVELSGGEAQRICLARALIRKPDLLLLDEATNALDSISEQRIQEALEEARTRCAVVVVAHRLSTVERANQILVLDQGRLVERGNFAKLHNAGGLFTRLYRLQQFGQNQSLQVDTG
jgi:subfamily B ATP-binding cassette protein MsbA